MKNNLLAVIICLTGMNLQAQNRAGLFGKTFFFGIEESISVTGYDERYTLVNRKVGRIKLEKLTKKNRLIGVNFQRQVFRVNKMPQYYINSDAYAITVKKFRAFKSIAPVGKYWQWSLILTENHAHRPDLVYRKFGDLSLQLEYGKSVPFISKRILLNYSLGTRLRLLGSEENNPHAPDIMKTFKTLNDYFWIRNLLKINCGLAYAF